MYEHIHFHSSKIRRPITDRNFNDELPLYYEESYINAPEINFSTYMDADFFIDGDIKICFPHPFTPYAKEHLFCIQWFVLLNVGQRYFTRREQLDSYELLYTYDGQGSLEYNGKTYIISKGEGFLIDCKKMHYYKAITKRWNHAVLHFNGGLSDKIFDEFSQHGEVLFTPKDQHSFHIRLEKLIETHEDITPYRELQLSNQLENILMNILLESDYYQRAVKNVPENIKYLVKYIQSNYMKSLTLDFLADFSGMNKYHLIRTFNKYMGCSPREYIIQTQIENAKNLLESTNLPANKIGAMVGIPNENYFGHLFKNRAGMSPGNYRKQSVVSEN